MATRDRYGQSIQDNALVEILRPADGGDDGPDGAIMHLIEGTRWRVQHDPDLGGDRMVELYDGPAELWVGEDGESFVYDAHDLMVVTV